MLPQMEEGETTDSGDLQPLMSGESSTACRFPARALAGAGILLIGVCAITALYPKSKGALAPSQAAVHESIGLQASPHIQEDCNAFFTTTGCDWTAQWSCEGQSPGTSGIATPVLSNALYKQFEPSEIASSATFGGSVGYKCCCEQQMWRLQKGLGDELLEEFALSDVDAKSRSSDYSIQQAVVGPSQETYNVTQSLRLMLTDSLFAQTYNVLTYNLCWGCMKGDLDDKTAMRNDLAKRCLKDTGKLNITQGFGIQWKGATRFKVTQCALNMGSALEKYGEDIGGYDLVGFQEASNVEALDLANRGFSHMMGRRWGAPGRGRLVSLYNEQRVGNVSFASAGYEESNQGRPFLILVFDGVRLIFINIHNCHPDEGKSWTDFPNELHERSDLHKSLQDGIEENPERKDYRVIMVGDFNDLEHKLPGNIKMPWNGAKMDIQKPLVDSCCSTTLGINPIWPGDYIFDSFGPAANRLPKRHNKTIPQSDHWPVEAVCAARNMPGQYEHRSSGQRQSRSHKDDLLVDCNTFFAKTGCDSPPAGWSCEGQNTGKSGIASAALFSGTDAYLCCCEQQMWSRQKAQGAYSAYSTPNASFLLPSSAPPLRQDFAKP